MNLKNVSSCLQYEMQLQNVSLQHADAPSSRYWAVSAVISNSHVDCWLLYICSKLWARQHNISPCESPGSCSTWGKSSVKHYLLNPWMCMKRSWQVAASFPIMPPSLSRSNKKRGEIAKEEKTEPRTSAALKCPHENLLKTLFSPFICSLQPATFKHFGTWKIYWAELLTEFVYTTFARRMWKDFQFL